MNKQVNVSRPSGASRYQAPSLRMGRSQFDLTHSHKTMYDASKLIPYFVMEIIPGDTVTCKMLAFQRIFSPLDAPIMDDIESSIDFFFVPNRLVWDNWEKFLGASDTAGAQQTDYTIPILSGAVAVAENSIANYMGIPIGLVPDGVDVSALPFRAMYTIWNEWYRDQNLEAKGAVPVDNGPDTNAENAYLTLPYVSAKKHDYFTSALPYLQKGDPVTVGLAGNLPVVGVPSQQIWLSNLAETNIGSLQTGGAADTAFTQVDSPTGSWGAGEKLYFDPQGANPSGLQVNTAGIAISVNALREAEAVQRLLERDARGGTRHPELIRAHFGVDVPDYRTQRPEYLGGGRGMINVSPVANTSSTATEDQGQLTGVGTGTLRASWAKSFVEHGYVIGILRSRGQLSYQQGLDRMWSRSTRLDFLWPELVNLGEQPIYNREIFVENDATDDAVFGYQERYADYRWKRSLITGKLASDATGSLDFWHLAEDFGASTPALNATFIKDATPMVRVTTVDSEPDFIIDGRFDLRVARILPVRPTPSLAPARF